MNQQQDEAPDKSTLRWALLAILLLGFIIRLGAAVWWESRVPQGQRFAFGDSVGYEEIAKNVANGQGFAYGTAKITRTPGYPLLLAPIYWFVDQPPTISLRLIGILLGVATIGLAAWLCEMVFGRAAGLISAMLVAFYPGAIAMSVFVLAEVAFVPLMVLTIGLATRSYQSLGLSQTARFAAFAGATFGLSILVRPSWMLFPLFVVPIGLTFYSDRKKQLVLFGVGLVTFALVMTPWWIRNYQWTGRFVPTTLQVGASLYDGLNPKADGSSNMDFVPQFKKRLEANQQFEQPISGEVALDRMMRDEAIAWARQNPGRSLQLAVIKLGRVWNPIGNDAGVRGKSAWLIAAGFIPIGAAGMVGFVTCRRRFACFLLFAPAVYFSLLHMVFVGSIRYRQPAVVLLAVLAAGLVSAIWSWCCSKRSK